VSFALRGDVEDCLWQLEEVLDEAQQVIRTALRSDNKEHKLAAASAALLAVRELSVGSL